MIGRHSAERRILTTLPSFSRNGTSPQQIFHPTQVFNRIGYQNFTSTTIIGNRSIVREIYTTGFKVIYQTRSRYRRSRCTYLSHFITFISAISITCIGEGEKGKTVYRNGAKETDLICVSGDLGAAYMGLQLLEREKIALKGADKDVQPDFAGKEYLLERQLKPEARRDIIERLAAAGVQPTAMMDISDGLSSELMHICSQSKVGCRVYEEHIPIDYQTAVMAEEFNMNLTTCALNGGEDYELLFTVPIADHEKVSEMEGVKLIGHITKPELGCALITRDGQEFELKAQGWNPLKDGGNTTPSSETDV